MAEYRVILQDQARRDLNDAYHFAARHAPDAANRWVKRFHAALGTLESNPQRCPEAAESRRIRQLRLHEFLFGRRPNVFRVIYYIDGQSVQVLRIRRAARRYLSDAEIRDALGEL